VLHSFAAMKLVLLAGTAYVAAVFAAGFALGVLRTLALAPLLGELGAVLVELPVILTIAWLVCTRILRRWPLSPPAAAAMGTIAFALLMLAEAGLSTLLAGRSLTEHLALYAQLPHRVGLAGQLAFALFPWMQARRAQRPPV
jgi:hypothetical protein